MTDKMKDNFSWLYGKKISYNIYVPNGEVYTYEDSDGDMCYLCSPQVFAAYNNWLDSMPLLKALE